MPRERPVHHKALGAYFVGLREKKEWKQKEAAELAQRRGLRALSRQVLLRLERGQIKNPEPSVLKAAATLYGVSYDEIVQKFVALHFNVEVHADPIRQSSDQRSNPPEGRADVPASPGVEGSGVESQRYQQLLAATEEIADRLLGIIGEHRLGEATGTPPKVQTGIRKRGRKVG